jgi:hypothetical protein
MTDLYNPPLAPPGLLFLATFNRAERHIIRQDSYLQNEIRRSSPAAWRSVFDSHRSQRASAARSLSVSGAGDNAMRRQAHSDLSEAANRLSMLVDGRRVRLFHEACRLAKYTVHGVIADGELRDRLMAAAAANGSLAKYGYRWAEDVIGRALSLGRCDPLPLIARRFRVGGAE